MAKKKICLDAGHYGHDYNAGAVKGYYESEIVWKLTQYEKECLEQMGIEVVTTRTHINANPGLTARGQMAKGCDLFVSNHTNATSDKSKNFANGLYMVPRNDSTIDDRSKAFAQKLAKVIETTMGVNGNECWSVLSSDDRDGNGKKDDNYYAVLHGAFSVGVPGIIAEHSFHTNPYACEWLMNDANLRKLAKACAECMAEFVGVSTKVEEPKPSTPAPAPTPTTTSKWPKVPFMVRVLVDDLNYRSEPSMNGVVKGQTGKGSFTIVEVRNGWGKLKSGAGWILIENPAYCTIVEEETKVETPKIETRKYPVTPFMVRVTIDDLNIRTLPSMEGVVRRQTGKGSFTIVEVSGDWGRLKSGAGWIYLANREYLTII